MKLGQLDRFAHSKTGLAVQALIELGLAYIFVSLAIDSGSLLEYLVMIVLVVMAIRNLVRLLVKTIKGMMNDQPSHAR